MVRVRTYLYTDSMYLLMDISNILISEDLNRFHNFNIVYRYVCPGSIYSTKYRTTKAQKEKKKQGSTQNLSISETCSTSVKYKNNTSTSSFGFVTRPIILLRIMLLCLSRLPRLFSCRNYHLQNEFLSLNNQSDYKTEHEGWSFSLPQPNGLGVAKGLGTIIRHINRGIKPVYMTDYNGWDTYQYKFQILRYSYTLIT